ncbi:hypothetical protein HFP15_24920 [Amycolatopsis sp. K13G38]|uniref:Enoyl-CoA hydratase n=1 Tax=Amycolatopsis acididurans TaxID=2724524 RepID=A0ABX1JCL8_9PSEU|nr:enoyl-CoA hydratase-related protein [Amycolatopsis acididurans]NKQ56125.1 hypothetical protein [Amycolatopsis acididurans]
MTDDLIVEKIRHTTVFTINRPERLNALGGTVLTDLTAGIKEFQADPGQYVAIITGTGTRAFSSGADLKEMAGQVPDGAGLPLAASPDMCGLGSCNKVTIAAVNGLAVAGGLALCISCDIRIASDRAWFALPEVRHGILAGRALTALPRLLPFGTVADLMLTGDGLDAQNALRLGLVQQVVPQHAVLAAAVEKADTIARNSPAAVWGTKQVLNMWRNFLSAETHNYYQAIAHQVFGSGDVIEGSRAFAEKRQPEFVQAWPGTAARGIANGRAGERQTW